MKILIRKNDEKDYILKDVVKGWRKILLHIFECRYVFDIKCTNIVNFEEAIFRIKFGYIKFKSQLYGLNKKNQKSTKKWICIQRISETTVKKLIQISGV